MTVGLRCRLVIEQGSSRHVGSVVLSPDEVAAQLELEAQLHEAAGWTVERRGEGTDMVLECVGKGKRRTVSAEVYGPWDDV